MMLLMGACASFVIMEEVRRPARRVRVNNGFRRVKSLRGVCPSDLQPLANVRQLFFAASYRPIRDPEYYKRILI